MWSAKRAPDSGQNKITLAKREGDVIDSVNSSDFAGNRFSPPVY